jgi:hypothetical protein
MNLVRPNTDGEKLRYLLSDSHGLAAAFGVVPDLLSALTRRGWASAPRAARLVPHACMHMEQVLALSCRGIVCEPRIWAPAGDSSRQSMGHATALACLLDPRVDRAPQLFACFVSRPCTASWSGCSQPHLCLTCHLVLLLFDRRLQRVCGRPGARCDRLCPAGGIQGVLPKCALSKGARTASSCRLLLLFAGNSLVQTSVASITYRSSRLHAYPCTHRTQQDNLFGNIRRSAVAAVGAFAASSSWLGCLVAAVAAVMAPGSSCGMVVYCAAVQGNPMMARQCRSQ